MRRSSRITLPVLLSAVLVAGVVVAGGALAAGPATFVQQVTGHRLNVTTLAVTPPAPTTVGNRLIVEVGVWNFGSATITAVTDNAGDTFVKLLSFTASDHAQMSVWTAVVATGGTRPAITATATSAADIGVSAVEYAGLSTVSGTGVLDAEAHASGTTGSGAATVSSGMTVTTVADGELAVGFYADSGFGTTPTAGAGYTARATIAMVSDMDMLVEDRPATTGVGQVATAATGANTTWLMAVIVLKVSGTSPTTPPATTAPPTTPPATTPPPTTPPPTTPPPTTAPPTTPPPTTPPAATAPGAPTAVSATAGNASASVSWTAPSNGGSPITAYTVTPYVGAVAQAPTSVTGTPPATAATVSGLTNGTAYTFTVTATNSVGTGPASAPSPIVTPSPGGQWSAPQTWPVVALSNTLLYNGNLIAWDGWQQPQPSVVWNPSAPATFTTMNAPTSIFCDGAATLPDGRLLVVGGYGIPTTGQLGIVDTNIFDPATSTWTRVADMHKPRWYPTLTELADGRYVAISGNDTTSSHWADTPEVYDPTTNTWTLLSGVSTPQVHETEYPISYLVPNGKVFTVGPEEDNSFLLDVGNQTWTQVGGASGVRNGSSVMYLPGKVLYSGGGVDVNSAGPSAKTAAIIDLTAATPQWQPVASMNSARVYHTLTMMADGKVLAVGGSPNTDQGIITTGELTTEIWDPATKVWTTGPSMAAARNYHSTALLMPDGRILVAGGGHPFGSGGAGQFSSQYYSPPYLSNGPRPLVTSAPASAVYGSTIPVSTPDPASIRSVNLVSLGADTHQVDMNQHFVPLNFTANGSGLAIQAPATAELAPPGYYMLFIVDDKGVPSVASMVQIRQTVTAPAAPTAVSAVAGNSSASVSWAAPPNNGGSPILSYTITPSVAGVAQPATTVTGNPPATSTIVSGLANGAAYTFTVTAANATGTSPPSAPSGAVVPSATPAGPLFVQQVSAQIAGSDNLSVTLPAGLGSGRRLVVSVGVWSGAHAVTNAVTDSAGDSFVEIGRTAAADGTELSLWTAPVTNGMGQMPAIKAQASGAADIGIQVLDYSGLSTATDLSAIDGQRFATGSTSGAATVSSGATAAATAGNELALGFYADSGFGNALVGGSGWSVRANLSPNGNMDLLSEEKILAAGDAPNATVGTGPNTFWEMATVIFKTGVPTPPAPPAAPTNVAALPGNGSATVNWTAPPNGASVTSYTVTPYTGAVALPSVTVSGSPAPTSTIVSGLTNGTPYTFVVSATNSVGTGPDSTPSAAVTPTTTPPVAFIQQASARRAGLKTVVVTPSAVTTSGNRLIVEVAVWSATAATVTSVTDNAGDTFTKLTSFVASDKTQMSVWTAPVATGGTKPAITATVTQNADVGAVVLEYAGLSAAAGASIVDQQSQATGKTTAASVVTSGSTAAVTVPGALAIGFYADSGFGTALTGGSGFTVRANHSPNGEMDMLAEDQPVGVSATPAASTGTGPNTVWLMSTIVFKPA